MLIIALGVGLGLTGFRVLAWLFGSSDGRIALGALVQLALATIVVLAALALAYGT